MFGKSGANTLSDVVLKELVIDNLDRIPVEFCANLPLTAFEVKNINSTEINSRAFLNCKYLSKFAFPKAITAVYDSAFYNTAITAFNGSAVKRDLSHFPGNPGVVLARVHIPGQYLIKALSKFGFKFW